MRHARFSVDSVFKGVSCAQRYDLLCKRLVQKGLAKMDRIAISVCSS